jgi:hypothetical protein
MEELWKITRRIEVRTTILAAIIDTIAVVVVKATGAWIYATFIAGLGTGAVVVYVYLKNKEIRRMRRKRL